MVVDIWYGSKMEQGGIETQCSAPVCIVAPGTDTPTLFALSTVIVFPCRGDIISFSGILFWLRTQMTTSTTTRKIRSDQGPCQWTALGCGCPPTPPLRSALWRSLNIWGSVQVSSQSSQVWIMTDDGPVCFIVKPTCLWVRNISLQLMNYFSDWWIAGSPHSRVK